jgi:hypothetical protein
VKTEDARSTKRQKEWKVREGEGDICGGRCANLSKFPRFPSPAFTHTGKKNQKKLWLLRKSNPDLPQKASRTSPGKGPLMAVTGLQLRSSML